MTETGEFHLSPDAAISVADAVGETWHPASTVTLTENEAERVAANPVLHRNPACSARIPRIGTADLAGIILPPAPDAGVN